MKSFFAWKPITYIYHNQIDARGDNPKTENEVFVACEEAVNEIYRLIKNLTSANKKNFIVTADHGFLYRRNKLSESDKIGAMTDKAEIRGRRYVLSSESIASEGVASTVVGAPRANSIRMNYLQKRFEKRVESALRIMQNQISSIENNYATLNDEMQEKFRGLYVEWLMDNLYSERQPEKVTSHVNGYINMMTNDTNDDIMIMFMDTLNQLTQLDIDVLKLYTISSNESAWDLIGRYGIQPEQLKVIKEK